MDKNIIIAVVVALALGVAAWWYTLHQHTMAANEAAAGQSDPNGDIPLPPPPSTAVPAAPSGQ